MSKGLKIFVGVVVSFGILSGIFLLIAKKKNSTAAKTTQVKTLPQAKNQTLPAKKTPATPSSALPASTPDLSNKTEQPPTSSQTVAQDPKAAAKSQWTGCKNKTNTAGTNLFWPVQVFEGIPIGGTYAKGNLNGDSSAPVRVIVKKDSQNSEAIKAALVVGKSAVLRGTCTSVAADGAVVFEAF